MKRLLNPDTAREKQKFLNFKDELKQVYPNAVPYKSLLSPELCQQCESHIWTTACWIQRNINDFKIFNMCDVCYPVAEAMCQKYGYRFHVLIKRMP